MRKELTKATFALTLFAILFTVGFALLPAPREVTQAGERCADLVAQQAAASGFVVDGAWQCLGGTFKSEMVDAGVTDPVAFAETGPGSDPPYPVKFIAQVDGNAYLYEIGSGLWKFTVVDGKVVAYK